MIPFNKPFIAGNEFNYIRHAVELGKITGNGHYTKACHSFFENTYGFKKALLTSSCTDALEMAAILAGIESGDEVIMPSYAFVSTANAFVLRGANIIFADSCESEPNIDASLIEALITTKTKAIVIIHYAGVACNMEEIMRIANKHHLLVIEDAAQAIDSYFNEKPLGGIGHFGAFSFHETKNISSGEGGMLIINDDKYIERAEIIWEKGTNRAAFFRGEVDKYNWVDIGSSFLPSDLTAAFLFAQLEHIKTIQQKRKLLWHTYHDFFMNNDLKGLINLPYIPSYASNNAHMFYLVCNTLSLRTALLDHLKKEGFLAVFHYQALHKSPYYKNKHDGRDLPNANKFSDCLIRLPLFFELEVAQANAIAQAVLNFFKSFY